jgi:hypothetical protein
MSAPAKRFSIVVSGGTTWMGIGPIEQGVEGWATVTQGRASTLDDSPVAGLRVGESDRPALLRRGREIVVERLVVLANCNHLQHRPIA